MFHPRRRATNPEETRFRIVLANKTSEVAARVRNARETSDANIDRGSNYEPQYLCSHVPLCTCCIRGGVHLCMDGSANARGTCVSYYRRFALCGGVLSSGRYQEHIGNIGNITPYLRRERTASPASTFVNVNGDPFVMRLLSKMYFFHSLKIACQWMNERRLPVVLTCRFSMIRLDDS